MLRLLLVALPLVVASPAAFDAQEIDALQFEVQFPLQFEVRSPPESHPLRPAATRDQHDSPATHTQLRTHDTRQPHTSQWTRRGTGMRARRSTPRSTLSPTHHPQVCPPARTATTHAAQLRSALPLRARGRCACCRRTRRRPPARAWCPLPRLPDSVDSAPAEARCNLRWPSARASAPPRLFC